MLFLALWFFLPAGIANVMPVFAAHIPVLKKFSYPIDGYKTFRGKRIFGDHKTVRGFVVGISSAIIIVFIEKFLFQNSWWIRSLVSINYNVLNPFILGALLAIGALGGDAIKSFFKRQWNIQPGKAWFPFDQLDYIVGGILATIFYIRLSNVEYITIIIIWFLIHMISTMMGYVLKLKESPL